MIIQAARRRTPWQIVWVKKHLYLYLVPTFFVLAIFSYYPPLSAFYHAFFDWDGVTTPRFIGLGNFREMAQDPVLLGSIPNLIKLVLASLVTGLTAPLLVAELIFSLRGGRAAYFYRLFYVMPVVVPTIVTLLLWQFIFDPNVGPVNGILGGAGLISPQTDWFGDPHIALYTLMLVGFPWVQGVNVLIYLAGLQNIPASVHDAALLDGATGWRRLRYIDLPLVMGQVKLLLILGIIGGVQGFSLQFVLTQGGPGNATMVPGYLMYQTAFQGNRFGYGSAIGLALFLVILLFTYLNMRFVRTSTEYEAS